MTHRLITVGPRGLSALDRGCTRRKTGQLLGFRSQNLQLDSTFCTGLRMQ